MRPSNDRFPTSSHQFPDRVAGVGALTSSHQFPPPHTWGVGRELVERAPAGPTDHHADHHQFPTSGTGHQGASA